MDVDNTQYFDKHLIQKEKILSTLVDIYTSLREKGYEPHDQVVGYLLSGDPVYITSYNGARGHIQEYTRDEIIEVLLKSFLSQAGTVE